MQVELRNVRFEFESSSITSRNQIPRHSDTRYSRMPLPLLPTHSGRRRKGGQGGVACRMLAMTAVALLGTYVLFGRGLFTSKGVEPEIVGKPIPKSWSKYRDPEHLEKQHNMVKIAWFSLPRMNPCLHAHSPHLGRIH